MNTSLSKVSLSSIFQKFIVALIGTTTFFLIHTSVGAYEYLDLDTGWLTNDQNARFLQNFSVSGNVGIGTTTPVSTLELRTATPIITLSPSGYTNQYQTTLGTRAGAQSFLIFGNNAQNEIRAGRTLVGGYLDFYTNNTTDQSLASDGNLAMRLAANGNVGIGTTAPGAKLDVNGSANINGDLTVVGKVITDTLVNRTVAQLTVSGSIFPNATSSQKDLGATGNRWANLWLSGNANVTGSVTAGSFAGNGSAVTSLNASNLSSGTVPDARLSTNVVLTSGNQTIGGTKTFSSTIAGSITGNAGTVTNGVYTTSSYADPTWLTSLAKSKVGLANVDNTSDVNKPVSTAQQTALNLKANLASPALTGTPTAPTAATATNTTQIATTAFVKSQGYITAGGVPAAETDPQVGANTTNYLSKWNGTSLISGQVFDNGTNIGIGTAGPGARLDIYETADDVDILNIRRNSSQYTSFKQGAGGSLISSYSDTGNAKPLIIESTTNSGNISPTAGSVGMRFRTLGVDTLTITQSGNIGIGTTSPGQKLDVSGGSIRTTNQFISTLATGTAPLAVSSTTVNTNLNADLLDGQHGSYYAPLTAVAGTTNYVSKFTGANSIGNSQIFDNGTNIGIGTATPGAKLDVNGTINIARPSDFWSPASYISLAGIGYAGTNGSWRVGMYGNGYRNNIGSWTSFNANGNIGRGSVEIDPTGVILFGTDTLTGTTNPTERMRIGANGSVGIGTTAPGAKLDVNGSANINGDLTVVGKVITDTLVNRTVAQLTVSGSIFPNATSSQKDIGATGNRWANLWLSGNANVTGSVTAGSFAGNGSSLTSLNASNLSSGTIPDARLSTNVVLTSGNQTIGGTKTFSSTIAGSITGNADTVDSLHAASFLRSDANNATIPISAADGNGLKFWNGSNAYKIAMGNAAEYHYGPVTDYSIKTFIDSNSSTRGFTWGQNGVAPIAALNVGNGNMQIAGQMTATQFNGALNGNASSATNADTVDGYHEGSFLRARGGVTGDAGTDTITGNGVYSINMSGYGDIVANFGGVGSSTPSFQLRANYGDSLWFRASRDAETTWDGVGSRGNRVYMDNYHPLADSAGNSTTVGGLAVHAGTNNEANKIVRTDGNGYIQAGWINTPSGIIGDWGNGNTKFYASNDSYIRYLDRNSMKVQLGLTSKWDADRRDYTADSSYFVGSMGWGTTDLNTVFDWGSGFWDSWSSPANSPGDTSHYVGINAEHYTNGTNRYGWQMAGGPTSRPWFRQTWGTSFGGWQRMLTDSNDPYAYNMNQYVRTTDSPTFARVYTSDYFRSTGATGWYNETYNGGWYMSDTSWIRSYGDKNIWLGGGLLGSNGGLTVGYGGAVSPGGGAIIAGNVGIGTAAPGAKLDVTGGSIKIGTADQGLVFHGGGEKIIGTSGWGIDFQTSGGTSRMTILNNGNVGVGTASPSQKFTVLGKSQFSRDGTTECCGNDATITLGESTSSTARRASISFHNGGVHEGTFELAGAGSRRFRMYDNQGSLMGLEVTGHLDVGTNIYTDGNYGYGHVGLYASDRYQGVFAMGDSYKLPADGTTPGNLYGLAWTHDNVGGQAKVGLWHQLLVMMNGTTYTSLGNGIWTNGNVSAAGFFYNSDIRLKKDIKPLESSLDKIQKLNGYNFTWKNTGKKDIGVIAQEVEQVFPELVGESQNQSGSTYKTVEYGNLVAPLIEAVKEIVARIDTQEARHQALLDEQKKINEAQQREIDTLKEQNREILKRLESLSLRENK